MVSDIGLPDGTGLDLIRQVRDKHHLTVPAIALTGFGMEDDMVRCREAGFDAHLTKPINLAKLEETVQRIAAAAPGIECA
jgi:CheY-like chemotaxis protein